MPKSSEVRLIPLKARRFYGIIYGINSQTKGDTANEFERPGNQELQASREASEALWRRRALPLPRALRAGFGRGFRAC